MEKKYSKEVLDFLERYKANEGNYPPMGMSALAAKVYEKASLDMSISKKLRNEAKQQHIFWQEVADFATERFYKMFER